MSRRGGVLMSRSGRRTTDRRRRLPARARAACLIAAFALAGMILPGMSAMAYEEPEYTVARVYEDFELRRYPPQILAETEVSGAFSEVGGQAFRILADYISGKNRRGEKIAMTAPVSQQPAGEKIAMTTPVSQSPSGDGRFVFAFFMPSEYTMENLPLPADPRVRIRQMPARWMAARRYSGGWRESRYRDQESALLGAVRRAELDIVGQPVFARYNSPFTLWFLRRNEVLLEVDDASARAAAGEG